MTNTNAPHLTLLEASSMPERVIKPMLALAVPPGLKLAPAMAIQFATSAFIGFFTGLDAITISLLGVQLAAAVSSLFTHGYKSDQLRKTGNLVVQMWLLLAAIHAVDQAKLLPIYLYPYLAGYFIGVDMLALLKNASDSGLNTPWLDRIFRALKANADAGDFAPGRRDDVGFEELKRRLAAREPVRTEPVQLEKKE